MRRLPASAGVALLIPVVAFAADADKKGMPQLDPTTFASQIFWLAVFFALFYGFMRLVAMPRLSRIIAARQARISDDLYHATTASGEAHALKTELEKSLGQARDQARSLLAAANDDIRKQATASDAKLSGEIAAKIEQAETSIHAARAEALGSIEDIAVGIVSEALPKIALVTAGLDEVRGAVARAGGGR